MLTSALPWARVGRGETGVGTHQDTIQSPRRLYKAPTDYTKTQNTDQISTKNGKWQKHLFFFKKACRKQNKKRRPTAPSKHGLGLPILTKYWLILINIVFVLFILISIPYWYYYYYHQLYWCLLMPYWCPIATMKAKAGKEEWGLVKKEGGDLHLSCPAEQNTQQTCKKDTC